MRLLKDKYGGAGRPRARALALVALVLGLVTTIVLEALGATHLIDTLFDARDHARGVAEIVVGALAFAAAVPAASLAVQVTRTPARAAVPRSSARRGVKDQLGFMDRVRKELDQLFAFMREFGESTAQSSFW